MNKEELLKELDEEISRIWGIYLLGKESLDYANYLYNPTSSLEKEYVNMQKDLSFIRFVLFKNSLIDLSKLFQDRDSDKCNINKFLRKIQRNGYFRNIFLEESKILDWENKIKANGDLIKKITTLRDKVYSHYDPNFIVTSEFDTTFKEVEDLFDIVKDIITTIHLEVFDTYADLGNIHFNKNRFKLIEILAKDWNARCNEIIRMNTSNNI